MQKVIIQEIIRGHHWVLHCWSQLCIKHKPSCDSLSSICSYQTLWFDFCECTRFNSKVINSKGIYFLELFLCFKTAFGLMLHCIALHFKGEIKAEDAQWVTGRCSAVLRCFRGADAFMQIREEAKKNHCIKKIAASCILSSSFSPPVFIFPQE